MELVQACTSGDVQALYEILSQQQSQEELALMVNLTTEGGVTLLMHTIIGAGRRSNFISLKSKILYLREREREVLLLS